jgi:hypothetical protein
LIHLQGMGVIGSALAWALHARGIPFTWSDTDDPITSWRASTGAVYPSLSERDAAGYRGWERWFASPPWTPLKERRIVERAAYWYCTKMPPHGFKTAPARTVGRMKMHPLPSFHLNAQTLVPLTRQHFASLERPLSVSGERLVVAHGFNDRLRRYVWGWMRPVVLDTSNLDAGGLRPSVYLRQGRVVMAYAYPIPGTIYWYAGSTLLVQGTPKTRDPENDVARWRRRWDQLTGGLCPVLGHYGPAVQGWRPSTGPVGQEPMQRLWEEREAGTLVVMPCWHSGVRWLPLIVEELLEKVQA